MEAGRRELCRRLLRECRRLPLGWSPAAPASEVLWGRGFPSTSSQTHPLLLRLAPSCLHEALQQSHGAEFSQWLRAAVRRSCLPGLATASQLATASPEAVFGKGEAEEVVGFLQRQSALAACTAASEEGGLRFNAVSGYMKGASDASKGQHVFAYNMRFTNTGSQRLRVLGRIYDFRDEQGNTRTEIKALPTESAGVVGYTPLMEAGASFEFGSGSIMATPRGSLVGRFLVMVEPDLAGADAKMHQRMEEAELTLRYVYYKSLGTQQFYLPIGPLNFDADVPCVTLKHGGGGGR